MPAWVLAMALCLSVCMYVCIVISWKILSIFSFLQLHIVLISGSGAAA